MIARLHYITQELKEKSHVQLAQEACAAGAEWIQLRLKNYTAEDWKNTALETLAICNKYNAKLIINDNAQLAKEIGAHGVHLGKEDMSTVEARRLCGNGLIIGGTANTFEDIQQHAAAGVDYIGLGPFRFTATKEKLSPVLGVDGYRKIVEQCYAAGISIPVIAIGGITAADVEVLMGTGIYGVAVAAAITHATDKKKVIENFSINLKTGKGAKA
ncbi:MAG: thiamine phosphate synthase [Bacteroidia bacterium]